MVARSIFSTGIFFGSVLFGAFTPPETIRMVDTVIRGGTIYDGSGSPAFSGDIAIHNDTIVAIGNIGRTRGVTEIDARGLAVAPGFINMLSWADKTLLLDGRAMSDITQGITLEVMGEGWSPGPVKRRSSEKGDSLWTTLGGYFDWLSQKGFSPNVASFVGHTSVRNVVLGYENVTPTASQLEEMKRLVAQAMEDGALGLGTSLIYPPASYAKTEELIALAKVAASYGGMYITHMRSEADFIVDAVDEALVIGREANIPVEIYHLKVNMARNWNKLDIVLHKIDSAQRAGMKVTANMYPYAASATGLTSRLPNWIQEGGARAMRKKLLNPTLRRKVLYEMANGIPYKNSDPADVMLLAFASDSLNTLYKGKRLDEVARLHGRDPDETVIDLIVEDKSRIETVYFLISEDNVRRIIQLPYVSFGTDAGSLANTPTFEGWSVHPRAYGTFPRVLAKYVREEKLLTLEEAIRRMTSLPASNLNLEKRGLLKPGWYADVVVFDPDSIQDHATFEDPAQYSTGILHVFVNGTLVLYNGAHTGALSGRVIRGRAYEAGALRADE
jgi:N-acyl-D-amino-acid deacylase